MSPLVLNIVSLIIIAMAVMGLVTGKIMAGSRGFSVNYYSKEDNPFLLFAGR